MNGTSNYYIVLKKRNFNSLGVSNFGAISLNQIPNDENSIKGHNMRGIYWTIPDEKGEEVVRDIPIGFIHARLPD